MKKLILLFSPLIFLSVVTSGRAGEADTAYMMARHIMAASNLSGTEKIRSMEQYVCRLPDNRLLSLLQEIGGTRFLTGRRVRGKNQGSAIQLNARAGTHPATIAEARDQLSAAVHAPEDKMYMCRSAANFLFNTARHPGRPST